MTRTAFGVPSISQEGALAINGIVLILQIQSVGSNPLQKNHQLTVFI